LTAKAAVLSESYYMHLRFDTIAVAIDPSTFGTALRRSSSLSTKAFHV
jgi:hypothetical protein